MKCWTAWMMLVASALGCGDSTSQGSVAEQTAEKVVPSEVSPALEEPNLSDSERRLIEAVDARLPLSAMEVGTEDVTAGPDASLFAGYQTRDHQLWLHSGTPSRYTVKDKEGKVLARGIDDARLKRDYTELHDLVHNAVDLMGFGD